MATHAMRPRLLGLRSAQNRAKELKSGRSLPPHKEAVVNMTGRLLVHFANASNSLFYTGEVTAEGEPRVLLSKLLDLNREVTGNLRYVFPEQDDADPLAMFTARKCND